MLFGSEPDADMLNYRARQLMALLHAGPLVEHVLALDPRITYRFDTADYFSDEIFVPQQALVSGETRLSIFGEPSAPDVNGRMHHSTRIEVLGGETVSIRRSYPLAHVNAEYAFTSGVSNKLKLGVSGYEFRMPDTVGTGDVWVVETLNRPQWDLGQLVANLELVGEPALLDVFGTATTEPYATFRNLWRTCRETPLRLGGLVLALIYATEARRG